VTHARRRQRYRPARSPRYRGLTRIREESDYALFPTIEASDAETAVRQAEIFVDAVVTYLRGQGFEV
jgi:hypothetical protein